MRRLCIMALVAAVALWACADVAQAVLVKHTDTGGNTSTLVFDDFEGVATGGYPDSSIWSITFPQYGGSLTVVDDASPGAHNGHQYVKFEGEVVGDGPYVTMNAHFPLVTSGELHAEWMMYIPDPGSLKPGNFGFHQPSDSARVWASWNRVTPGQASTYLPGSGYIDIGVPIVYDQWQLWQIDYDFAPTGFADDTYTISVDDFTSGPLLTWRRDTGINAFVIGMSATTSTFYVDSVPEPSTLVLLGLGLVGLAGCRRRRRRSPAEVFPHMTE